MDNHWLYWGRKFGYASMKVGDRVTLVKYPTWGVCEVVRAEEFNDVVKVSVRRCQSEGITYLCNIDSSEVLPYVETLETEKGVDKPPRK